jgi:hypothetical protein
MANITVKLVWCRGRVQKKPEDLEVVANSTVEELQTVLADRKWQWSFDTAPVPANYCIMTMEASEFTVLPLATVLRDDGVYHISVSKKNAKSDTKDGDKKDVEKEDKASKRGRPSTELPQWMGENGVISTMTEYLEAEKLIARANKAVSRARKDEEVDRAAQDIAIRASCKEKMSQFRDENPQLFKSKAKRSILSLQAKLDRFALAMTKEFQSLAHTEDEEENPPAKKHRGDDEQ